MLKCLVCSLAFLFLTAAPAISQSDIPADQIQVDPAFAADYKAADKVLKALQADDRRAVAALIAYPLSRTAPLAPIRNSQEFLSRWDEFFDAGTIRILLAQKPNQYGWRGVALADGRVWFAKGHITAIYTDTSAGQTALADAKGAEGRRLYPSVRGYAKVMAQCSTPTLTVRAQYHGKDLRYFAWKKGAALSSRPALELRGGTYDPQGTGGNFNLNFASKGFSYQLQIGHNLCGDDCHDYLDVVQGNKILRHEICTASRR